MIKNKPFILLIISLFFFYALMFLSFHEQSIFWYLYTFTLVVSIAISFIGGRFFDELPTWHYLIYGIGYGTISYGIIRVGFWLLSKLSEDAINSIHQFLNVFGPTSIWHYVLLIFIIIVGEEMFWRGFVQQQLKKKFSTFNSILITALLFTFALLLSGFIPGAIAAFITSLLWGALYEWKKSLPLIIVAHLVFVILLFLVLPLTA